MTDDTDPTPTRRALLRAAAGTGAVGLGSTAGCVNVITPVDRAERTAVQGNVGYLVGVPWLADNRDDVVVLDARNRERFRAERIYGARHVPLDRVTQQHETGRGLAPDTDTIATAFADRGLDPTDDVVVYGASIGSRVTRVVFALEAVGHEGAVRVLNGGVDPLTRPGGNGTGRLDGVDGLRATTERGAVVHPWMARRTRRVVQRRRAGSDRLSQPRGVSRSSRIGGAEPGERPARPPSGCAQRPLGRERGRSSAHGTR